MIGDSLVYIDPDDNIIINGTVFRGKGGQCELLTRKNVNTPLVVEQELKT